MINRIKCFFLGHRWMKIENKEVLFGTRWLCFCCGVNECGERKKVKNDKSKNPEPASSNWEIMRKEEQRIELAKAAMQTICWDLESSTQSINTEEERQRICEEAVAWADALLKALKK